MMNELKLEKRSQGERLALIESMLDELWQEYLNEEIDYNNLQTAVYCQIYINRIVHKLNKVKAASLYGKCVREGDYYHSDKDLPDEIDRLQYGTFLVRTKTHIIPVSVNKDIIRSVIYDDDSLTTLLNRVIEEALKYD